MRPVLAIAAVELRRLARDKLALFFLVVLPFVLILVIGSTIPSGSSEETVTIGVVQAGSGPVTRDVMGALRDDRKIEVESYDGRRELARDVQLGVVDAGVVLTADLDRSVAEGGDGRIDLMVDPARGSSTTARARIDSVVEERSLRLSSVRFAEELGVPATTAEESVASVMSSFRGAEVRVTEVGGRSAVVLGGFTFVAIGQVVLFVFINSLAGGSSLVEMRTNGVAGRALAAPIGVGQLIGGITLTRLLIALGQAGLIIGIAALVFGVGWGDPLVVATVVFVFSVVAAGAGVLTGALARTPDQAVAIGVPVSLAMAALGGCMFPLSFAPRTMQLVARIVTPHAWATTALADGVDGASLSDVTAELAVLLAWAVVVMVTATVVLHRRLTRPS